MHKFFEPLSNLKYMGKPRDQDLGFLAGLKKKIDRGRRRNRTSHHLLLAALMRIPEGRWPQSTEESAGAGGDDGEIKSNYKRRLAGDGGGCNEVK